MLNAFSKQRRIDPSDVAAESNQASSTRVGRELPWNPIVGIVFIILTFFGAQLLGGLLISFAVRLSYGTGQRALDAVNSVPAQFVFILTVEVLTVGLVVAFLRFYNLSLASIGLKRPRIRDPFIGLVAIPAYYILFGLLVAAATQLYPSLNVSQKQELGFDNVVGQYQLLFTFVSLVVLPPLAEEIVFRGFIYTTLRKPLTPVIAGLITSVLFGIGHLAEGGSGGPLYIAGIQTFTLSLVLVYLRQKTGNLWASIVLHASNNLIAFSYLYIFH